MLKGVLVGVALTLIPALAGAYALVRSGLIPANADAKPGWLETWATGTSLDATLGRDAPTGMPSFGYSLSDREDLDPGAVPEAHGQAAARGKAGLATSPEPAAGVREPRRSEIGDRA